MKVFWFTGFSLVSIELQHKYLLPLLNGRVFFSCIRQY